MRYNMQGNLWLQLTHQRIWNTKKKHHPKTDRSNHCRNHNHDPLRHHSQQLRHPAHGRLEEQPNDAVEDRLREV